MSQAIKSRLFAFKGTNRNGDKVAGEIKSEDLVNAKRQLRKQGVICTSVKTKGKPLFTRDKKIIAADIAIFTRQLATMLNAGVPLVQSFSIIADVSDKPQIKNLIWQIRDDVSAGGGFATALRQNPRQFDELFCSLVASAEATGTLDVILNRLAHHKEKAEKLKSNIKKALTYPAAVMLLALLVSAILLIEVVPVFAETFRGFGTELPAFTLFVLGLSDALTTWWLLIVCAVSATLLGFREAHFRNSEFAYAVDEIILKLPVIGLITYHSVIARFARTLATTLAAGLPIIEALDSTADAAGNRPYQKAILQLRNEVISGISLQQAISNNTMFPRLLQQMTAIGEESGALDEMLANVASHYEAAVVSAIDNFTSLIEPLMMAVLGVLVGGLLIAMYLPIFQLGNVV